jgi:hypothetical protein
MDVLLRALKLVHDCEDDDGIKSNVLETMRFAEKITNRNSRFFHEQVTLPALCDLQNAWKNGLQTKHLREAIKVLEEWNNPHMLLIEFDDELKSLNDRSPGEAASIATSRELLMERILGEAGRFADKYALSHKKNFVDAVKEFVTDRKGETMKNFLFPYTCLN